MNSIERLIETNIMIEQARDAHKRDPTFKAIEEDADTLKYMLLDKCKLEKR